MQADIKVLSPHKTSISFNRPLSRDLNFAQEVRKNILMQSLTNFQKIKKSHLPTIPIKSISQSKSFQHRVSADKKEEPQSSPLLTPDLCFSVPYSPEIKLGGKQKKINKILGSSNQEKLDLKERKRRNYNWGPMNPSASQSEQKWGFRTTQSFSKLFCEREKKKREEINIKKGKEVVIRSKSFKQSINIKKYKNVF